MVPLITEERILTMRLRSVVSLAAALLVAGCGQYFIKDTLTNRRARIRARSSAANPFGVNNVVTGPRAETEPYQWQVALAGVGSTREAFRWGALQPKLRRWDWSAADRIVDRAQANGLQLLPVLDRCATWARRDVLTIPKDKTIQVPNVVHWENHVRRTVERYKDKIDFWQIWDRPDDVEHFAGTPEEYVRLLKIAYTQARRADSDCVVLMGGAADPAWLESALAFGAGKYCDIVGVTLSGSRAEFLKVTLTETGKDQQASETVPLGADDAAEADDSPEEKTRTLSMAAVRPFDETEELRAAMNQLAVFKAVLAKHKVHKPIWVTSASVRPAPAGAQARFLVKLYAAAMAHGADRLFWEKLVSESDSSAAAGLLYPDLSLRTAGEAHAVLSRLLKYATSARVVKEDLGGLSAYEFRSHDETILVAWGEKETVLPLPAGYKQVYNMLGQVRPLTEGEEKAGELAVGIEPVFITAEIIAQPDGFVKNQSN